MALAPAVFLQAKMSLELDFDSFNDLKEHPMAEPFLANFEQLLEGMAGSDLNTILSERIDNDVYEKIPYPSKKAEVDAYHCLLDILDNMGNSISITASVPNLASAQIDFTSKDIGKAATIALK